MRPPLTDSEKTMKNSTAVDGTVVGKTAAILLTFTNGAAHTFTEIVAATGLPPSTAHRLIAQLTACALLERTAHGDYRIGRTVQSIGAARGLTTTLESLASLLLQDLSHALDVEARLGVLTAARRRVHREGTRPPTGHDLRTRDDRSRTRQRHGESASCLLPAIGRRQIPRARAPCVHATHDQVASPLPTGPGHDPAVPCGCGLARARARSRGPRGTGVRPHRARRRRHRDPSGQPDGGAGAGTPDAHRGRAQVDPRAVAHLVVLNTRSTDLVRHERTRWCRR